MAHVMWPLPIPLDQRDDPCDFIPDAPDETGLGAKIWKMVAQMTVTQGRMAGHTFGETAPPWQRKWVNALYGPADEEGRRYFDEALLFIPKKNGKSTFSAALAIAHAIVCPESRGLGVILANTREQAHNCYDPLRATIEADVGLSNLFHVRSYKGDAVHRETGMTIKVIASELSNTVGVPPNFYIIDELHQLGERQKAAAMVRQLSSGTGIYESSLGIYITTAPINIGSGIYQSTMHRARRILAGDGADDRLFPVLFELPESIRQDPELLRNEEFAMRWAGRVNPSLGYALRKSWFKKEYQNAVQSEDEGAWEHHLSQHWNIPAAEVLGVASFVPVALWDACASGVSLDELLTRAGKRVWAAIDAGGLDDPSALAIVGESDDGEVMVWCHQWLHKKAYDRAAGGRMPFKDAVNAGEMTVFSSSEGDVREIEEQILRIKQTNGIISLAVDPWGLREMVKRLEKKKIKIQAVPQGWKMSPFIQQASRDITGQKISHSGGPLLRKNVENARLKQNGEAVSMIKPALGHAGDLKIDGIVATIMALAARAENPAPKPAPFMGFLGAESETNVH